MRFYYLVFLLSIKRLDKKCIFLNVIVWCVVFCFVFNVNLLFEKEIICLL